MMRLALLVWINNVAKPRPLDLTSPCVNKSRMIRDDIKSAQIAAMKAGDKDTRAAISLIQAAIKNRDIEARAPQTRAGKAPDDDDALIVEVLQKMVKQRRESIEMYQKGGREELAAGEAREVAVIERFLPTAMDEDETKAAIEAIKSDLGAGGMKDMGRVMAELKARHATTLDMSKASALVKAALS
jgi:hypothetical protein